MERLEVDYILGRRDDEMNGMHRYAGEIITHAAREVDGRLIDYRAGLGATTLKRLVGLFYYPFVVSRAKRKGSVKHVCSHIQAHLLNYMGMSPSVVTCYDIYPFLQKEYPLSDRTMVRMGLRGMLKADRIITISRFSRDEIARATGFPRERIEVTYLGVDHERYRPLPEAASLPPMYAPPVGMKTILYVGSEQPRKNLPLLLRAFACVKKERKDVVLLKVGRPQWKGAREELVDLARRLGLRDDVLFFDYVPEESLPVFYNAADLFVFPSRYEGFGLPPLEAMACGCPVVTSNAASLPGVVGEAGMMVDPDDDAGLVSAICKVLEDDGLRGELKERGCEQARRFRWEETARETIAVYRKVLREV